MQHRKRIIAEPQTAYEAFQMKRYGNVLAEPTHHMVDEDLRADLSNEDMIEAILLEELLSELYEDRNDD